MVKEENWLLGRGYPKRCCFTKNTTQRKLLHVDRPRKTDLPSSLRYAVAGWAVVTVRDSVSGRSVFAKPEAPYYEKQYITYLFG